MANSLNAVKRFTKAIIDGEPWKKDPLVVRKPWSYEEYALKEHGEGVGMCFAVMGCNGVVRVHPPVERALRMVRMALEACGHKGAFVFGLRHFFLFLVLILVKLSNGRTIDIWKYTRIR